MCFIRHLVSNERRDSTLLITMSTYPIVDDTCDPEIVVTKPSKLTLGLSTDALELERQRRIDRLAGPIFRLLQLLDKPFGLSQIEHRQRRGAMCTGRASRHIDRSAAVGAVHAPDISAQLLDLLRRQRPDEVLLAEEVEEGRQPAVAMRTAQILELRVPLNVVGAPQPGLAARALGDIGIGPLGPGALLTDDAKQLERRARRQRRALVRVEPERLTGMADIDGGAASQMGVERRLLHRRAAPRAVHGCHCS